MQAYTHILACVDFSEDNARVVGRACELARHYGARLSLIHVLEPLLMDAGYDLFMDISPELDDSRLQAARERLEKMRADIDCQEVGLYVEEGSTKGEILRVAEQNGVDLIVIGSHGRHGINLLLGSTANAVLHGACCDVLSVRVPD